MINANSLSHFPPSNGPVNRGRRNCVPLKGARKIWGTLRSTTTLAVENALKTLTRINVKSLIVKRKFKTAHNNKDRVTKWWFVIRDEESVLEQLQKEWPTISIQTSWRLEPVLSYADYPASPDVEQLSIVGQQSHHNAELQPPAPARQVSSHEQSPIVEQQGSDMETHSSSDTQPSVVPFLGDK